jgi:hypothetical protein
MRISQITRRDIIDAIAVEKINWSGRLEESEFLSRLFNLAAIPSYDPRFTDAAGNIWKHRVNNDDWGDDWVFYDARFNLMNGDDETFLAFLCETIHPVVRSDPTEAERICQLYNQYLRNDGFQIVEKTRLSGKPVYVGRYMGVGVTPAVSAAKQTLGGTDPGYIAQQITRMEASVLNDPTLAIGTAKELVETCCKTILEARNIAFSKSADLPELVKLTTKELELTPAHIPDKAKAAGAKGLGPRHAKLAVGAASTLAVFLAETHNEKPRK